MTEPVASLQETSSLKGQPWEEWVAAFALMVVFASVVWGVIARYVAPQPATWSNELATIGFAWVVFLGAAAAAKKHLHLGVDLVTARMAPSVRARIAQGVSLFLSIGLFYMAYLATKIGIESWSRPTPVLRIPVSVTQLAAGLGFASMGVTYMRDFIGKKRKGAHA